MSEWRGISSAPKDGTVVDLRRVKDGTILFERAGFWGVAKPQADGYRAGNGNPHWLDEGGVYLFPMPTHWRPRTDTLGG